MQKVEENLRYEVLDITEAMALEAQADRYFMDGALAQALACQVQATDLRISTGDKIGAAAGAQSEGLLRWMLADFAGAIRAYRHAYKGRWEAGDIRGQAVTLCRMAEVFQHIGQHRHALRLLRLSLKKFATRNYIYGLGVAMNNIGVSYRELRSLDEAQHYYDRSLELRRQTKDYEGLAVTLFNLSVAHHDRRSYMHAQMLLEEAIQICETTGNQSSLGQITLLMGMLHK